MDIHIHNNVMVHYNKKYGKLCNTITTFGGGGCCSEGTRRGFFYITFDGNNFIL